MSAFTELQTIILTVLEDGQWHQLAEKNGWKIKIVRMVLDILMVVIGVLLGGKFGICTVATVLLSGPIIQATVNTVKKSKIFKTINDNI